jgi:transposase
MNDTVIATTNQIAELRGLAEQYAELCILVDQLKQENAELAAKVKWYEEQFRLSQKRRFGASSEKTDCEQLRLFNEVEAEAQPLLAEPTIEKITYQRQKQKGRREAILLTCPWRR